MGLGIIAGVVAVAITDLTGMVLQSSSGDYRVFLAIIGGGLYLVYDGFNRWKQMRLVQDTATEQVRSAAAGRTELNGVGRPLDEPVERPFGDEDCLAASYEIKGDDRDGRTTHSESWHTTFQIDDGTGTMRVEPDNQTTFRFDDDNVRRITVQADEQAPPEIESFLQRTDGVENRSSASRLYTERWIPVDEELYVLGGAEPVESTDATSSELVMRRDEASEEFIVSTKSQADLVDYNKTDAQGRIVGGLALSALGLYLLLNGGF